MPPLLLSPTVWLALAATTLPTLLAWNVSPSPTALNQALAFVLWGGFAAMSMAGLQASAAARTAPPDTTGAARRTGALLAALALLAGAAAASWGLGALPSSLGLSAIGTLAAAAVLVLAGAAVGLRADADRLFAALAWGLLLAGLLNVAVACVQVFAPALADGAVIARSSLPGRAVGNLRQPNHLSSLLLWACIAAVVLVQVGRLPRRAGAVAGLLLVGAVVLTASRTGLLSVLLLALWGVADRRLSRPVRGALLAAPLVYALAWGALAGWAAATAHSFGGSARLAETDISSSRFAIWSNTLDLIRQHPWTGVGWGEFNFAWTLTPFPGRPVALFDHTHNLPLQLAVELGLPLAAGVAGLLGWALWRAARAAWDGGAGDNVSGTVSSNVSANVTGNDSSTDSALGMARRGAVMAVLMIGLHSMLEYPLWYAYFLLPTAWLWGFALGAARPQAAAAGSWGIAAKPVLVALGAATALGGGLAAADYSRVAAIFSAGSTQPLAQRVAAGQRSLFFAHHADYAALTSGLPIARQDQPFGRATHYLLDTRLMLAWARHRAALGDADGARHLAARLREFRNPGSRAYFAVCDAEPVASGAASSDATATATATAPTTAASAPPLQCQAPQRDLPWQAFVDR